MAQDPQKEEKSSFSVSYDLFSKLDIQIATIVSVDEIPKSSKLLKLTVKLGNDKQRVIVAGIKQAYDPADLVGSQIVVLTNLEPRTVFGATSNGMLLAADVDGRAILLRPDTKVPEGSRVR